MKLTTQTPFDGIESAHEFLALLSLCVGEAKIELEAHVAREIDHPTRRLDALRIAEYKLERLQEHVNRSVRLLNDLRSLRRLVFEERLPAAYKATPPPAALKDSLTATPPNSRSATNHKPELVAA